MIKVVIIDDEPKAIELLKNYIDRIPFLECLASFRNSIEGLDFLRNNEVDIVLLDINMPKLSGVSLAKIIRPSLKIIFTTAYSEYAVESYELNAVDYLLKPITFERFLKALSKVKSNTNESVGINKKGLRNISVKSGYEMYRIKLDNILYLEKDGNYITYYTTEKKIVARESISEALEKLPDSFVQVHKSFIISIDKIDKIATNQIVIKDSKLPIGKNFKEKLIKFLNQV